jgi:hypothetical protein
MNAQTKPNPLMYVACYALWLVLSAAAIVLLFLTRTVALNFAYMLGWKQMAVIIVNWGVMVVMGIVTLIIILVMEDSFRTGVRRGKFWPRAGKAAFLLFLALAIVFILNTAIIGFRFSTAGG